MKKEYKLTFEMVPEECWYANLRSVLKPADWDRVRRDAYARANGKCMICGRRATRLEAHEKWSYDDKKALQKLEDVVALCHACHEVKHISRTQLMGRGAEAEQHFMKVNGCTQMDFHAALGETNEEYVRRNKIENWTTDISWLEGRFDITLF
ncbi:MAG: HNH endonuclease [Clostridia bacterium]|nr:HNH endonuclease [Clostridia bacterium]